MRSRSGPTNGAGSGGPTIGRASCMTSALKLLKRHGYRRVRLEDIARDAGVSKAIVYHYFANKDDLLTRSVASRMAERQRRRSNGGIAATGGQRRPDRLRAVLEDFWTQRAQRAVGTVAADGRRRDGDGRAATSSRRGRAGLVQRWQFVETLIKEGPDRAASSAADADAAVAAPPDRLRAGASGALPRSPRRAAVRAVRRSTRLFDSSMDPLLLDGIRRPAPGPQRNAHDHSFMHRFASSSSLFLASSSQRRAGQQGIACAAAAAAA